MYRFCCLLVLLCEALSAQTVQPEAILKQALDFHKSGDLDGAVREYRAFLKLKPTAYEIRSNLGAALAQSGRYEEAIPEYKTALASQPASLQIALNLSLAYYKSGRIQEAAQQLAKARPLDPTNQQVTLLLADCYLRTGENKKVASILRPVYEKNPEDLAVDYLFGTALVRDDQAQEGQRVIDRILRNGDSAEARLLMGTTKMAVNDFAGAREDLAKAVELNNQLPDVNAYYGLALLNSGDTVAAGDAFRRELAANPNDFTSNLQLGGLLRQDQQNDEALKLFDRALRVRPGDLGVRYQIAAITLSKNDLPGARRELEQIVKESPNFIEAHVSLATVYYRLKLKSDGDRERALVQKLNAEVQAKQPGVNPTGQTVTEGTDK